MSLSIVSRAASANDCVEAASTMWFQQEFPRKHFKCREDYEAVAIRQIEGCPALIAYHPDAADLGVAWLAYDLDTDLHFPGRGATVYHLVVDKYFPEALPALMREFVRLARANGCEWYQTTKRVDEVTLTSTFKRLSGGARGQAS
jgi:hypothetical protein